MAEAFLGRLGLSFATWGFGGVFSIRLRTSSLRFSDLLDSMAEKILTEEVSLYAAIGRALTMWSGVENSLQGIYSTAISPENTVHAQRAFWAVVSFEARLKMVNEVLRSRCRFKPEILKVWNLIFEELPKKNKLRNKIAHGTVVHIPSIKGHPRSWAGWYLAPYHFARRMPEVAEQIMRRTPGTTKPYDPRPKERFRRSEIDQATAKFSELEGWLEDLFYIVQREACRQEGVPLADEPKHQSLLTALTVRIRQAK